MGRNVERQGLGTRDQRTDGLSGAEDSANCANRYRIQGGQLVGENDHFLANDAVAVGGEGEGAASRAGGGDVNARQRPGGKGNNVFGWHIVLCALKFIEASGLQEE